MHTHADTIPASYSSITIWVCFCSPESQRLWNQIKSNPRTIRTALQWNDRHHLLIFKYKQITQTQNHHKAPCLPLWNISNRGAKINLNLNPLFLSLAEPLKLAVVVRYKTQAWLLYDPICNALCKASYWADNIGSGLAQGERDRVRERERIHAFTGTSQSANICKPRHIQIARYRLAKFLGQTIQCFGVWIQSWVNSFLFRSPEFGVCHIFAWFLIMLS